MWILVRKWIHAHVWQNIFHTPQNGDGFKENDQSLCGQLGLSPLDLTCTVLNAGVLSAGHGRHDISMS